MIEEKAEDLGRLIGQSDDYRAIDQAREALEAASELRGQLTRLEFLAESFAKHHQEGTDPSDDQKGEYDRLMSQIQGDSRYQRLVAAESNFDKLMHRVNQHIMKFPFSLPVFLVRLSMIIYYFRKA